MLGKITAALRVMRPRAIAHTGRVVEDLSGDVQALKATSQEVRRALKLLQEEESRAATKHDRTLGLTHELVEKQTRLIESVTTELQRLNRAVHEANVRASMAWAIARRDAELENERDALTRILADRGISNHIRAAVAGAPLQLEPFPHVVVDNLLPAPLYDALITGLPPLELFGEKPVNKQHLNVPLDLGPEYARHIWRFMGSTVTQKMIMPAVLEKFREPMTAWLRPNFPALGDDPVATLDMVSSEGRILLRRRGYRISPHRDPKWGLITCLLYLARPGDDESWGTQLYAVDEDEEARTVKPLWIDASRCRLVGDVTFRPNRALMFLNSVGAHGAHIPAEGDPAAIERYAYQFRVGVGARSIATALSTLPADRRPYWEGKLSEY